MTVLLDAVGRRRSPAIPAGLPRRATAAQQGHALSRRPADRRGGRGRDATNRRRPSRLARASNDRCLVALGAAHPGRARSRRARCRPPPRIGSSATAGEGADARSAWTSGAGSSSDVAARTGRAAGRAADSASSTGPPTAGPGQASAPAANPHDRASSGADVGATRAPTLAPAREVELIADAGAPPESDPGPACGSPEDRIDVEGQVVRILSEPVCLG